MPRAAHFRIAGACREPGAVRGLSILVIQDGVTAKVVERAIRHEFSQQLVVTRLHFLIVGPHVSRHHPSGVIDVAEWLFFCRRFARALGLPQALPVSARPKR